MTTRTRGVIAALAGVALAASLLVGPAVAKAAEWRLLVIVYAALDATCDGEPVTSTMTPETRAAVDADLAQFAATVETWTLGALTLGIEIEERAVLDTLDTIVGAECWPAPQSIAYPLTGYDSILVVWPPPPLNPGWGALRAGRAAGPSYATVITPQAGTTPHDVGSAMLHEWTHNVQSRFGMPNTIDTDLGSECSVVSTISPDSWAGAPLALRVPDPDPCGAPAAPSESASSSSEAEPPPPTGETSSAVATPIPALPDTAVAP